MKRLLLFSLTYLAVLQGFAQDVLIPYRVKDKWGYASPDGALKIAAQYDHCWLFDHSYALAYRGCVATCMMGAINTKNEVVIPFIYDQIYFAAPLTKDNKKIYRNAIVYTKSGKYGIYDLQSRQLILDTAYSDMMNKVGTLFTVSKERHEKGIFDASSQQWIAEPVYYEATPVSDTFVKVEKEGKEFVIPVHAGKPGQMSERVEERWSSFPPPPPGDGVAVMEQGEVVDEAPKAKQKPAVRHLTYKEQLVLKDGKYGFRFNAPFAGDAIPAIYDSIDCASGSESQGLMAVKRNGKWGVVNAKNAVVCPFIYEGFDMIRGDYKNGFFVIVSNGKKSIIDKKGKVLVSGLDDIYLSNECFLLTAGEDRGVLFIGKGTGPLLIKPQFDVVISPSEEVPLGNGKSIYLVKVRKHNSSYEAAYLSSTGRLFFED